MRHVGVGNQKKKSSLACRLVDKKQYVDVNVYTVNVNVYTVNMNRVRRPAVRV